MKLLRLASSKSATDGLPPMADLLNALPTPLLCLNPADEVVFANAAAEAFFKTSQSTLRDRGLGHLLPADSPLLALIREARLTGGSLAEYALEIGLIAGGRVTLDATVGEIPDQPGWLLVTIQSRSIAQMMNRQMTHEAAARQVVGVSAMLAHEIRNPLSGIRGAAQLLDDPDDASTQELSQLIVSEVDRIRALVDRMETFTDTRPLERRRENIHNILSHVRQVASAGIARSIPIRERYDPSLPEVFANRDRLIQVFLNLVKNAAEAIGDSKGEILITTAYRHGVRVAVRGSSRRISLPLEVCVCDTGPGAPTEIAEHLFDPFVSSKPGGSGLGLALAAKIVRDHGGVIEYDRQYDPPLSTFRILLPVADDPMADTMTAGA